MNIDNINKMNNLVSEQKHKEQELEDIKDEIRDIRSKCEHISVKVANLQIDNVTYCLFCGKRVTRQRNYFIDAHNYKKDIYGDGFTDKERVDRLHDLQSIALDLYKGNSNLDNEELSKELKRVIEEEKEQAQRNKVLKNVLGKWVGLWMSKK